MPVPFVLLVLSLCAAWLPPLPLGQQHRLPLWLPIYLVAVLTAFIQGFLQESALVALIALVGLAAVVARTTGKAGYGLAFVLLFVLSLALALHKVPGFSNPIAIHAAQFTPDAKPFTQYLNFDKGSVGLVLIALLSSRLRRGGHAGQRRGRRIEFFLNLDGGQRPGAGASRILAPKRRRHHALFNPSRGVNRIHDHR